MQSEARKRLTPTEYLAIEREAKEKSEFFNGEMFAMSGASHEHNLIVLNVGGELRIQLRGRPCETYPSDMRVKVSETGLYTYPDVVVVCGDREFAEEDVDTLVNPTLIVEVLSPSTEAYDRGDKFAQYREIASLKEYVLISQQVPRVERYLRQPEGTWLFSDARGLDGTIHLSSIDCDLRLAEIYERLVFPTEAESAAHPAEHAGEVGGTSR